MQRKPKRGYLIQIESNQRRVGIVLARILDFQNKMEKIKTCSFQMQNQQYRFDTKVFFDFWNDWIVREVGVERVAKGLT